MAESQVDEVEWEKARYEELNKVDEYRLQALYHMQGYQRSRTFNKKVKHRDIRQGDLVLKELKALPFDPRGKAHTW